MKMLEKQFSRTYFLIHFFEKIRGGGWQPRSEEKKWNFKFDGKKKFSFVSPQLPSGSKIKGFIGTFKRLE